MKIEYETIMLLFIFFKVKQNIQISAADNHRMLWKPTKVLLLGSI